MDALAIRKRPGALDPGTSARNWSAGRVLQLRASPLSKGRLDGGKERLQDSSV